MPAGETTGSGPPWALSPDDLLAALGGGRDGLSSREAAARLDRHGANTVEAPERFLAARLFLSQFRSPLVLILVVAIAISALVGDWADALIIGLIILGSSLLGMGQEYRAARAMEALRQRITTTARCLRDGLWRDLPAAELVPGDVVRLAAGDLVPADAALIEANDLFVVEAALTGESFPVEKSVRPVAAEAPLAQRTSMVFMGTSVRSGTATAVVTATGSASEFGAVAAHLARPLPETAFAQGIRRFGYLMSEIMLAIALAVFAANLAFERPLIDSLLFSLALAVGLTPELLPAIISVTLARGAQAMAASGVIVRRLVAIENLGSMNVLCTDKTGTLTEGIARLERALDPAGSTSTTVLGLAVLNARLQTGLANPLDAAILAAAPVDGEEGAWDKAGEIPYDFVRKRLTVIVRPRDGDGHDLMICKGAFASVIPACTAIDTPKGPVRLDARRRRQVEARFETWGAEGYRVLAIAHRRLARQPSYRRSDEEGLIFGGFLLFSDPPRQGIAETLQALAGLGVRVKVITGDNRFVADHLVGLVGIKVRDRLTGEEISHLSDDALWHRAQRTDLYSEVDPNQKERIVRALQRAGKVVGYLGDGINDVAALNAADVGISVETAVDVAKQAADMVLLQRGLEVVRRGIEGGRHTFANTLKYIAITTSANFGNMVSMAVASLFLPFLPLLARQILLNNLLSDIPSFAIAGDNVDRDLVRAPGNWNIGYVKRFMLTFGLVSSLFDAATFVFLLVVADAGADLFRTGWFVESLMTELAIVMVVRTHRPFYLSRPAPLLVWSTAAVAALTLAIPYLPFADRFAFVPLPADVMAGLLLITALYLMASEVAKRHFFRRELPRATRERNRP